MCRLRPHSNLVIFVVLLCGAMISCNSTDRTKINEVNYTIGVEQAVPKGAPMVSHRTGFHIERDYWVGLAFGGWVTDIWDNNIVSQEIIYEGTTGSKIVGTFVELKQLLDAIDVQSNFNSFPGDKPHGWPPEPPKITKTAVELPLDENREFFYKGFRVRIIDADDRRVRYIVLEDPDCCTTENDNTSESD